jgi:(p)ppGpp synthase/HD superfamily hydrolase
MSTLERAIEIAVTAHKGQKDLAGAPYILHPLRLMLSLSGEAERIVAVLHDVVEDCEGWSFERLAAEGFAPEIIEALRSVTKTVEEGRALKAATDEEGKYAVYEAFVLRAGANPIGRRVKMADLLDNSDTSRIKSMRERDHARLARYRRAMARLKALYPNEWAAS